MEYETDGPLSTIITFAFACGFPKFLVWNMANLLEYVSSRVKDMCIIENTDIQLEKRSFSISHGAEQKQHK